MSLQVFNDNSDDADSQSIAHQKSYEVQHGCYGHMVIGGHEFGRCKFQVDTTEGTSSTFLVLMYA